jgi:hypothetical protein
MCLKKKLIPHKINKLINLKEKKIQVINVDTTRGNCTILLLFFFFVFFFCFLFFFFDVKKKKLLTRNDVIRSFFFRAWRHCSLYIKILNKISSFFYNIFNFWRLRNEKMIIFFFFLKKKKNNNKRD